jgi:cytidylate kinase
LNRFLIAIDGPAGSGKSSVAKLVAQKMNMNYLDTGAMYRAVALYLHSKGLSAKDDLKKHLAEIDIEYIDGELYLNKKKVSDEIRSSEAGKLASDFATIPAVRERLTQIQRHICQNGKFVVEGRDIGTVVLPEADVKIFLTASFKERVRRRFEELKAKNMNLTMEDIADQIKIRDRQDSSRSIAPLKPAEDAIVIDTTSKDINEVADEICQIAFRRIKVEDNCC